MTRHVWDVSVEVITPDTMNQAEVSDMLNNMVAFSQESSKTWPGSVNIPDNVDFQVGFTKFICEDSDA